MGGLGRFQAVLGPGALPPLAVSGPSALCVGFRQSPPLCIGPRPSLCRGPLCVSPGALCVGRRVGPGRRSLSDPHATHLVRKPPAQILVPTIRSRSRSVGPPAPIRVPPMRSRKPPPQIRVPPISKTNGFHNFHDFWNYGLKVERFQNF